MSQRAQEALQADIPREGKGEVDTVRRGWGRESVGRESRCIRRVVGVEGQRSLYRYGKGAQLIAAYSF